MLNMLIQVEIHIQILKYVEMYGWKKVLIKTGWNIQIHQSWNIMKSVDIIWICWSHDSWNTSKYNVLSLHGWNMIVCVETRWNFWNKLKLLKYVYIHICWSASANVHFSQNPDINKNPCNLMSFDVTQYNITQRCN